MQAPPPCVTIYTFGNDFRSTVTSIAEKLIKKGIPSSLIQIHSVHNDRLLAKSIADKAGSSEWPIVFIDGSPINNDFEKWIKEQPQYTEQPTNIENNEEFFRSFESSTPAQSQILDDEYDEIDISAGVGQALNLLDFGDEDSEESVLSKANESRSSLQFDFGDDSSAEEEEDELIIIPPGSPTEEHLDLGIMGQTLEGLERSVVGISSYMRSAMNIVGLSPPTEQSLDSPDHPLARKKRILGEYKVIQTNWYYRQQTRILRFFPEYFARVHPLTDSVRSTHDYTSIEEVKEIQPKEFMIQYKDGSPSETYQSPNTSEIVAFLNKKMSTH
mmetsp:Transcript_29143/g.49823  ORF Transcript_29143/g.49823 Transcript_29143/m.49823 type:complete len:329 (+) Transcript_29143:22-1008(+)